MSRLETIFKIIEDKECPHYSLGDEFNFSGNAILLPTDKSACLVLFKDLSEFIDNCANFESSNPDYEYNEICFNCSGCTGSVRLEYKKMESSTGDVIQAKAIDNIARLLGKFSIFQTLDEEEIKELVTFLRLKEYETDDIIINKGDPGKSLFIITSGKVEVLDEEKTIAFLEKGEVLGEMSLLSGEPAAATVKVVEPTKILHLVRNESRKILHRFPSLKMYLSRLITQRLFVDKD
jgi:CRP/FNR family cyclic AMP-dependent transcriptional regulator